MDGLVPRELSMAKVIPITKPSKPKMSGEFTLAQEEVVPTSHDDPVAQWVESAGQKGEADKYAGKRHSIRFAEGMSLEVTLNPDRPAASWRVYMHNVSSGGFAFWSKKTVLAWSTVFVREYTDDNSLDWVKARVTHCTVGIRGYLVGAAFELPPPLT